MDAPFTGAKVLEGVKDYAATKTKDSKSAPG